MSAAESLNSLGDLLALRGSLWALHPIVLAQAKLPTPGVLFVLALVTRLGKKMRESVAFWAHPVTGKSSCAHFLKVQLPAVFPGCGVFVYEAKTKRTHDDKKPPKRSPSAMEDSFLRDILEEMEYDAPIEHALAGKRRQVRKALLALAGSPAQLFFIIDEAQELDQLEMAWLKSVINWLVRNGARVTVVLFGQSELLDQKDEIATDFRSDLSIRFLSNIYQFVGISSEAELEVVLRSCDENSEYPTGSTYTYTQFLFPLAYAAGFRLSQLAKPLWAEFANASPIRPGEGGIAMQYVGAVLSELAELLKDRDEEGMVVTTEDLAACVRATGYIKRPQVRTPTNTSKKA